MASSDPCSLVDTRRNASTPSTPCAARFECWLGGLSQPSFNPRPRTMETPPSRRSWGCACRTGSTLRRCSTGLVVPCRRNAPRSNGRWRRNRRTWRSSSGSWLKDWCLREARSGRPVRWRDGYEAPRLALLRPAEIGASMVRSGCWIGGSRSSWGCTADTACRRARAWKGRGAGRWSPIWPWGQVYAQPRPSLATTDGPRRLSASK